MPILVAIVVAVLVIVTTIGVALVLHIHAARRRATAYADQPAYQPTSVDSRGRWRISSLGDELIEPATYRLNTDPDGPPGDFPPPLYPAPERRKRP
ncbi:hypothetical protein [Prauserella rugosa]|uniref:Uncharacterized protein n=1 Tax=Prauserella rugosa TaxID=43354 RepID=A0A660C9E3_9PSEU|nr:hypothetical protein [Prauserella rugosa]KMS85853.1 hypothetical protein ACZ91_40050 [Streptomyces regensis]TWH15985.1 hypothetical protein JD82_04973 [Prauserella rugosa]